MSEVRFNFLNWQPDQDDSNTDGLITADNVIHESEGYKPTYLASAGSFGTTIAASTQGTVLSIIAKPVGNQGDVLCAWIANATTATLAVGFNGVTATSGATGHPLTFLELGGTGTSQEIFAFDVCELADKVFFTVEANQAEVGGTEVSRRFSGYLDY